MPDVLYTINGQVAKGSLSQSFAASGVTADMATAGVVAVTLDLDTSTTSIGTTNLGALGLCFARSLATNTTHTVSFGRLVGTNLYETVRLKAGEGLRCSGLPQATTQQKSAVSGSRLVLTIYED
jgi:hypothetical protein